jgi:3-hydroxyisobutyrate dehydrogenase-like beta-hydroxyacid dehydrogenase
MVEPLGFVGIGAMGSRMVFRLLDAGVPVVVWNRSRSKLDAVVARGAEAAADLADLSARCTIVIGCLLDDTAVEAVYGPLVERARQGQVFLEHGTFAPTVARRLSVTAGLRGAVFLDVPVTGGPEGAANGTLIAMAGGDEFALSTVAPILANYVARVVRVGEPGSGLELKLVNQLLVSIHMAAAGEAAALIARLAIPADVAVDVLTAGWAGSAMLARELPRALQRRFASDGATIGGLLHVQGLVGTLFAESGVTPRLLPVTRTMFDGAVEAGSADSDPAALVELYRGDIA